MTSDTDLARAAQTGDATALGILLERHRPRLYAHALHLVGYGHDAHDAVQDTFVIAMRRIGSLRNAEQVEGWLHVVLRNVCMDRLRARTDAPEPPDVAAPADEEPESIIDSLALRDWVWTSVGRLSEPLRLVTMLRHFSSCTAYDDIAKVCDVPVGTVRSRLSEARRLLAEDLLRTAAAAHTEAAERTRAERAHFTAAFAEAEPDLLVDSTAEDVEVRWATGGGFRGRETLRAGIHEDLDAGVGFTLDDVIAGPGITIIEGRFDNPADDPFHCPPATTQIAFREGDLTRRMVWHYAPRP